MKSNLLLCVISFSLISNSFSQDILTRISGDTIRVKVLEVGLIEVKYKKYEDLSGITYGILKSDVLRIYYANGRIETFVNGELIGEMTAQDKCNCGRADAEKYHGKEGGHFVLGAIFGLTAIAGTAAVRQTPEKGRRTSKLSTNKALFKDPSYAKCYQKNAKSNLLEMEAWGMTIRVVGTVALIYWMLQ